MRPEGIDRPLSSQATRRAVIATGAKLAYATPLVVLSMRLDMNRVAAMSGILDPRCTAHTRACYAGTCGPTDDCHLTCLADLSGVVCTSGLRLDKPVCSDTNPDYSPCDDGLVCVAAGCIGGENGQNAGVCATPCA